LLEKLIKKIKNESLITLLRFFIYKSQNTQYSTPSITLAFMY
jgi:hypothetical protein